MSSESSAMAALVGGFARYATETDDVPEVRLRKMIGMAAVAVSIISYSFYGVLYLVYDERPAAFAALTGTAMTIATLVSYAIFRRYALHWMLWATFSTTWMALIHLLLGGFHASGIVIIWIIVPPMLTFLVDSPRRGLMLGVLLVILVAACAWAEPLVARDTHFPPTAYLVFCSMNVIGLAAYILLALFYYTWRGRVMAARLEFERQARMRALESASEHKSQFLASVSHELRTPLNAILGFNEMILDGIYGPVAPEIRSALEEISSSGKHLLRLINNVLDLAKIEAGRMELALADYSVADTVNSVQSTLRSIALEKELEFTASVEPDLPLAHGDAGRISQCLLNLAGNALKFTKSGSVEISARKQGSRIAFMVTDTGIGIPPEKIVDLFIEFKQTDATIASEFGGTGLGLSITKKFVELHGGRIWVESAPGKGSSFVFEVPLRA